MKKYLLLLIIFTFIACNEKEKNTNRSISEEKNKSTVIKISTIGQNEITDIYTNYQEAFKVAKIENRPVFILFFTTYCRWCIKLQDTTLKNPKMVQRLNKEFIVLFLNRDKDNYPKKYKVRGVPAVYLTDKNEEIFTAIIGYHKNPNSYIKWFNYIQVELNQSH